MPKTVILFEDHTAQHFRPTAWSLPVAELPCGLFNLRERLDLVLRAHAAVRPVLLPRGLLGDLQAAPPPPGWTVGAEAAAEALADSERALLLSGRIAVRGRDLAELIAAADAGFVARDEDGLVAWAGPADAAADLLDDWSAWDAARGAGRDWTRPTVPVPPWRPEPEGAAREVRAWRRLWDRIPEIGAAVADDAALLGNLSAPYVRSVFGVADAGETPAAWRRPQAPRPLAATPPGVTVLGRHPRPGGARTSHLIPASFSTPARDPWCSRTA